jgi:hypothetical protein
MCSTVKALLVGVMALCLAVAGVASEISREQIKGLDEQVQDIKADVLAISAELIQLEEKLLYPSNTHFSLFVSFAPGEDFRLDALDIAINGQIVGHHLYTHKELESLKNGGVQRVYTGNVRAGEHALELTLIERAGSSRKFTHTFSKEAGPRLVEAVLSSPALGGSRIQFKDR